MMITKGMTSTTGLITGGFGVLGGIKEVIKFITKINKNILYRW